MLRLHYRDTWQWGAAMRVAVWACERASAGARMPRAFYTSSYEWEEEQERLFQTVSACVRITWGEVTGTLTVYVCCSFQPLPPRVPVTSLSIRPPTA